MSLEQLARFHQRIGEEPAIQNALADATDVDLPERMVQVGAKCGLEFTADEVRSLMVEGEAPLAEISDEDLEGVAGGFGFSSSGFTPTSGFNTMSSNLNALNIDRKVFPGEMILPSYD